MANQFDIVENLNSSTRRIYPYLVILQHDQTSALQTVIAAPLIRHSPALASVRLHPAVDINGDTYLVLIEQLAAISRHLVGNKVGTADQQRYSMISALDLLFTGT